MVAALGAMLGSATGTLIVKANGMPDVFAVSLVARVAGALVLFLLLVFLPAMQARRARA